MAKPKFSRLVSPVGIAKLAFVHDPSQPFEGKGDPQFKIRVLLDDTEENRKWCDETFEQGKAEAKANKVKLKKAAKNPFNFPEDADEDDFIPEDGKDKPKFDEDYRDRIWFETKSKYQPGLIDTARQALPEGVKIFNNDDVRTKIELNPYEGFGSGLSLRLITVQLVNKNSSFTPGQADTDGFGDVEDGYVAPSGGDDEDEDF